MMYQAEHCDIQNLISPPFEHLNIASSFAPSSRFWFPLLHSVVGSWSGGKVVWSGESKKVRNFRTEISDGFYKEIPTEIDHVSKFLAIPGDFWQLRAEFQKLSKSIYTRKSHKIDHFLRFLTFLAETERSEQKSQERELIAMSYLPKETLCFWPLPKISDRK